MIHILSFLLLLLHPFYVSVTDVNLNTKTNVLEISTKIFSDDLENGIFSNSKLKIDIIHPKNKEQANMLVASYLKKHFTVKVNNQLLPLKFIGYEINDAAVWCYLESEMINKISVLEIKNDVLIGLHPTQNNILNVKIGGKEENVKLDADNLVFKGIY